MKKNEDDQNATRISAENESVAKKIFNIMPFVAIGVVCFCVYYLLSKNTPPFGDDLFLKFVFQGWNTNKITAPKVNDISQIVDGMTLYYNIFRGRVIAEGITQLFAVYGKQYFNILNSLIFAGITFLVYYHSNYGKKANWRLYLLVSVVFWFLTPDLMATSLWMVGSLCEFWPVFFVLLFLVPFRALFSESAGGKNSAVTILFVIPFGFLAGAFNEQSFALSIGFAVLAIIYVILKQRKLPIWSIIGLVSTICGTLFVLLAPGNKVECLRKYGYTPIGLYLHKFPSNVFDAVSVSYKVTKVLLLFTFIAFIWLVADIRKTAKLTLKNTKKSKQTKQRPTIKSLLDNKNGSLMPCLFLIIAVSSVAVATALPYFDSPRLFFTVFVSFALVFFSVLSELIVRIKNSKNKINKALSNKIFQIAVPVLISLVTVCDFGKEFRIYHRDYVVYTDVVNSIEKKIAAGEKNIVIHKNTEVIPRLLESGRLQNFIFYWSITGSGSDPNSMENKWYAYCFDVNTFSSR